jgi:hypothetical protein
MDVLRTSVSKLINPYISGTLFPVFRNPTFLIHGKRAWVKKTEFPLQEILGNSGDWGYEKDRGFSAPGPCT